MHGSVRYDYTFSSVRYSQEGQITVMNSGDPSLHGPMTRNMDNRRSPPTVICSRHSLCSPFATSLSLSLFLFLFRLLVNFAGSTRYPPFSNIAVSIFPRGKVVARIDPRIPRMKLLRPGEKFVAAKLVFLRGIQFRCFRIRGSRFYLDFERRCGIRGQRARTRAGR